MRRNRCWLIVRPRPVPPAAAPDFVCVNASKISARASGSMPIPVSLTSKVMSAVGTRDGQPHLAAAGELDGVAEQVEQDLAEVPAVEHDRVAARRARSSCRAAGPCAAPHPRSPGADRRSAARISVGACLDVDAAGFDLRQVEHVVDQIEQVRAALRDRVERFALRARSARGRAAAAARSRSRR